MSELHGYVGYVVVAIFSVGWLFGLALWATRRQAGKWFWRWLATAQVLALVQALAGLVLLMIGRWPTTWLHIVYGLGPIAILLIGHLLAREEAFRARPWIPFSLASFICFGLSLRALTTGLGLG